MDPTILGLLDTMTDKDKAQLAAEILSFVDPSADVMNAFVEAMVASDDSDIRIGCLWLAIDRYFPEGGSVHELP